MTRPFSRRAIWDGVFLVAGAVVVWLVSVYYNLFDALVEFLAEHEDWQLDELVSAMVVMGLAGFVFALRRTRDLYREVQQRRAAEEEADWLAGHDALTGLPNRRGIDTVLEGFTASDGTPLGLYMIDLDGFKRVNDMLGHQAGDRLLVTVAQRLQRLLPGAVVARQGGDEFVVLVRDGTATAHPDHASRIISTISTPINLDGTICEVGASVGYAAWPQLVASPSALARAADLAMYAAKRTARNNYRSYSAQLESQAVTRAGDEAALRAALREGRIGVHYRPWVELETGDIAGLEVIPFWNGPEGLAVPAERLLHLAEQIGAIVELSESLLRLACTSARRWPRDVRVAFTLPGQLLADPLLGLRILKLLDETGLSPTRLVLQVTEEGFVNDGTGALPSLLVLRQAGIMVALDDFGSRYPGATTHSEMALSTVKIDAQLVAAVGSDSKQASILQALAAAGRKLELTLVAKGIEDPGQLEPLRRLGFQLGQGYLFGEAMTAEEAMRLMSGAEPQAAAG